MMSKSKVLVVDDEIHILHVVAIKLRNNDFEVLIAEDGAEALELAFKEKPDIIIADIQMPIMSGLELVAKLRENEHTKNIPVLLLTARNFSIEDKQKQELKISECLSKPFSPRELLRMVKDILHQQVATQV